jgi:hypothetical protein
MAETKNDPKGAAGAKPAQGGPAMAAKSGPAPTSAGATAKAPKPTITKLEAVKRALAKLGKDATPSQMQPYIKATFGIEMTTDHISTSKGELARRAKKAAEAAQQAASAKKLAPAMPQSPAAASAPAMKAAPAKAADGAILLADVLTTKELLDRVGADKLRTLIDGLAN